MKQKGFFLVFLAFFAVIFLTLEAASAEEAAAVISSDLFGGSMGEISWEEEISSDLWISADEYPREGGDALDDLIKSLVKMKTFDSTSYELEGNYEIVGEASGNLEEGEGADRVRLIALRQEDGVYDRGLLLEVIPSEGGPFIVPLPDDVRGFQSSVEVKNFTSRGKSEILLKVSSGKWGERFLIIAVANRRGEVILDTHPTKIPTVVGRFFDNYRAEIIVMETGERGMIDLSPRKAAYDRKFIYSENETLRSSVTVWVDKLSRFEPVDVDNDGIFEIKEVMDLSGAGRADRIAYVEAVLKYMGGKWYVIDTWIAPAEDLDKIPLPKRIN